MVGQASRAHVSRLRRALRNRSCAGFVSAHTADPRPARGYLSSGRGQLPGSRMQRRLLALGASPTPSPPPSPPTPPPSAPSLPAPPPATAVSCHPLSDEGT